ncbi:MULTISPECIES: YusW family protein [Listeria]|uniref:YusW family protein n=1 Tax=Listeria TaxID=1637 RepID=UPI000B59645B|nr:MULTISPECIES: YusW family protein [Listeria]
MNKFVKVTAITGLALTIGVATLAPTVSEAATVPGKIVYQDAYKKVVEFSKADVEKITGIKLTTANITKVYNQFKVAKTWENAGFTKAQAKVIASRASSISYANQLKGILTSISKGEKVGLKVIYVANNWTTQVNFGTYSTATVVPTPAPTPEKEEEAATPTPDKDTTKATALKIKDLEVEIEYKKKDVEIDYEVKSNGKVEAEYKNEFTGQKLKGKDAQVAIEKIFNGFDFQNKNKTQIINHVTSKLNLKKDFEKFEYEVKQTNNAKFEFKVK